MPTYKITAPDGTVYRVTGDGTEEEALAHVQAQWGAPSQEAIDQSPGSVRMGLMDILNAPAQLLEKGVKAVAPGVAKWLNEKNNELADMGVPLQRLDVEGGVDKQVRDLEAAYQAKRAQEGETGVDWGRIGGNVGGTLAGGWAARALGAPMIPAAATTTGRLASGAALGAGAGVLTTPATDPTKGFGEEKLGQALAGGLGGAGGEAVLGGMRALGQAARRPDVAALRARGV